MSDAGIGRVLVASLHQGIADILPSRLGFYENWLSAEGLREGGHIVIEYDVQRDLRALVEFLRPAAGGGPDVVFNAMHGKYGEDGCIQGVLEILDVPYTHSGVLASAIAMDKPLAKQVFAGIGLRCPEGKVLSVDSLLKSDPFPRPYVAKPAAEGSSVGVVIMKPGDNTFTPDMDGPWRQNAHVMVERYIAGRELTCTVIGDRATKGVTELRPKRGFYDYEAKYSDGVTEHLIPAPVPPTV